jgi:hypothetical protein
MAGSETRSRFTVMPYDSSAGAAVVSGKNNGLAVQAATAIGSN